MDGLELDSKELTLQSKNGSVAGVPSLAAGHKITSLSYNFEDTWRIGLGANYQYNDAWKFRFGVAYDESPVGKTADRTMTLPDSDRVWLSFGAKYNLSKEGTLDVGYSHIFFKDAKSDRAVTSYNPTTGATTELQRVRGEWNNNSAGFSRCSTQPHVLIVSSFKSTAPDRAPFFLSVLLDVAEKFEPHL